jgi:hypothetical protein
MEEHYIFNQILIVVKLLIIHFKIIMQIVMEDHYFLILFLLIVKFKTIYF